MIYDNIFWHLNNVQKRVTCEGSIVWNWQHAVCISASTERNITSQAVFEMVIFVIAESLIPELFSLPPVSLSSEWILSVLCLLPSPVLVFFLSQISFSCLCLFLFLPSALTWISLSVPLFPSAKATTLFRKHTKSIVWGMQTRAVQGMLDFDYVCSRDEPSVAAMVYPFT